jgi:hypothetical protein
MQSQKPPRPTGVTIIAILALAIGVIGLIGGAMLIGVSAMFASIPLLGLGGIFAGLTLIIAGVVLFFAFIWLLVGWGFLNGKGWAWTAGLIFSFLSILLAIFVATTGQLTGVVGLLIWGLMIYYLFTGPVKAFFGKGPAINPAYANPSTTGRPSFSPKSFVGPSVAGPSTGSFGASHTRSNTARFCNSCGSTVSPGLTKCSNCGASL